jgi:hypothetical protein
MASPEKVEACIYLNHLVSNTVPGTCTYVQKEDAFLLCLEAAIAHFKNSGETLVPILPSRNTEEFFNDPLIRTAQMRMNTC